MKTVKEWVEVFGIFAKYAPDAGVEIDSADVMVSVNPADVSREDLKRLKVLRWYADYECELFFFSSELGA